MEGVYLIHLNKPLSPNHTSRHYIGFATDVDARIQTHLKGGTGAARFMQVAKERNIDWVVARTWSGGTRSFERSLKNRKNASKLCPICTGKKTGTAAVYHEFLEGIKDITLYPLDGDTGEDNLETIEKEADVEEASLARRFLEYGYRSEDEISQIKTGKRNEIVDILSKQNGISDLRSAGKFSASFSYGNKSYEFRATTSALRVGGALRFHISGDNLEAEVQMAMLIVKGYHK